MSSLLLLCLLPSASAQDVTLSTDDTQLTVEEAEAFIFGPRGCFPPPLLYVPCESMGKVWSPQACACVDADLPTWKVWLGMNPNDAAVLHNNVLANDLAVRGDAAMSVGLEDMGIFLETGAAYIASQYPDQDPALLIEHGKSYLNPFVSDGVDLEKDSLAAVQQMVALGAISSELGAELQLITTASVRGEWSARETLDYVDNNLMLQPLSGNDLEAATTFQAVLHASYDFWDSARVNGAPGSNTVDALWTVAADMVGVATGDPFLILFAPVIGGYFSDIASHGIVQGSGTTGEELDWALVDSTVPFSETLTLNGELLTVDGTLGPDGASVLLRDINGAIIDEALIDPSGVALSGRGIITGEDGGSQAKVIIVPVFLPWGIYFIYIDIRVYSIP